MTDRGNMMRDVRGVPFTAQCDVVFVVQGELRTFTKVTSLLPTTGELVTEDLGLVRADMLMVVPSLPPEVLFTQALDTFLAAATPERLRDFVCTANKALQHTPLWVRYRPNQDATLVRRTHDDNYGFPNHGVGIGFVQGKPWLHNELDVCYVDEDLSDPAFIRAQVLDWLYQELGVPKDTPRCSVDMESLWTT